MNTKYNIMDIIEKNQIKTFFQPVISTKKKTIVGYEALTRGFSSESKLLIMPLDLFKAAETAKKLLEFDRLCMISAIKSFKKLYDENNKSVLFLNLEVSLITKDFSGLNYLSNLVKEAAIPPKNIIIEIVESKITDMDALQKFIATYRALGFMFSVDDSGISLSNLDRIFQIRPNIIKIDKIVVQNLDSNYHKQEIFKSLVGLAKKIGALIVAEGTENESEILVTLELGADMIQGFFFCEPKENHFEKTLNKLDYIMSTFKDYIIQKIKSKNAYDKIYDKIINTITKSLATTIPEKFEAVINQYVSCYPFLECIYIIDLDGIQITNTIFNLSRYKIQERNIIFQPANIGENHESKDYYYFIKNMGIPKFSSESYISLGTGNLCSTISQVFRDITGERYILCIDVSLEPFQEPLINLSCRI